MIVRALNSTEWRLKRDLRLSALRDSPKSFGSSYEREVDRSEEEWRASPQGGVFFAAFDDHETALGIAGGWVEETRPDVVHLISMWVVPEARGAGVAGRLTAAVVAWARERNAARVELEVAAGNEVALGVYLRCGFVVTGREPSKPCGTVLERSLGQT